MDTLGIDMIVEINRNCQRIVFGFVTVLNTTHKQVVGHIGCVRVQIATLELKWHNYFFLENEI